MSEYVWKQPLLEILKQESGIPNRMYDTKQGIKRAIEQIQSGALDAPEPTYPTPDAYEAACKALWERRDEVQRLREALVNIKEQVESYGMEIEILQKIWKFAYEALSATELKGDKRNDA